MVRKRKITEAPPSVTVEHDYKHLRGGGTATNEWAVDFRAKQGAVIRTFGKDSK